MTLKSQQGPTSFLKKLRIFRTLGDSCETLQHLISRALIRLLQQICIERKRKKKHKKIFFTGHLQTYHASFTEVANYLRLNLADQFSLANLEAAFKKYELTGMIISSVRKTVASTDLGRSYSLGGRDMLIRGPQHLNTGQESHHQGALVKSNNTMMHDLNSDLSKLVINIPFSHVEDDEDIFVEDAEKNQSAKGH